MESSVLTRLQKNKLILDIQAILSNLDVLYEKTDKTIPISHIQNTLKTFSERIDKTKNITKGYAIQKCWANFSNGDYICWHNHVHCDKSMVYYLKNKSNIGTMFKKEGLKLEISKGLQNSALIFDSNLTHSVPCHLFENRYSIAFDLVKT